MIVIKDKKQNLKKRTKNKRMNITEIIKKTLETD